MTAPAEVPTPVLLSDFLAEEDPPAEYRIAGLLPVGGRAMLAAQFKSGKTTMVGNLLRSLADGDDFLNAYATRPAKVVLIDDEMDPRQLRRWLRSQQIRKTDHVKIVSLRGRVGAFAITNPDVRALWAERLRNAEVLIFDCLRPVLDALNMDENHEAGRFLVAYDALLKEAGVGESVVVHHMGHGGDRSRGDSRLRDWPDVEWRLIRQGEAPNAPRYFSAYGRDVDVPEVAITYDLTTRHLAVGHGNRVDAEDATVIADVLEVLADGTHQSRNRIEAALKDRHTQKTIRRALDAALSQGRITETPGPRGARMCQLTTSSRPRHDLVNEDHLDLVTSSARRDERGEVETEAGSTSTTSSTRCDACGYRLDPAITAEGLTTHPNCEPSEAA